MLMRCLLDSIRGEWGLAARRTHIMFKGLEVSVSPPGPAGRKEGLEANDLINCP